MNFPKKFFVTGTDTGVGKTIVSAILTLGLGGIYWKPVQTGATDTSWIKTYTELDESHFFPERYVCKAPLSPHHAAALENISIDMAEINLPQTDFHLIIEGAGGLMVPLNADHYIIDLIKKFDVPVLVVCRSTLGTINHTLLTLEQLRRMSIPILGVVMNGIKTPLNEQAILTYGKVPHLFCLEPIELSKNAFEKAFHNMMRNSL